MKARIKLKQSSVEINQNTVDVSCGSFQIDPNNCLYIYEKPLESKEGSIKAIFSNWEYVVFEE